MRKIYTWGKYEYESDNDDNWMDYNICKNCINIWDNASSFKNVDNLYECSFEEFKESPFYVKPDYTPEFLK